MLTLHPLFARVCEIAPNSLLQSRPIRLKNGEKSGVTVCSEISPDNMFVSLPWLAMHCLWPSELFNVIDREHGRAVPGWGIGVDAVKAKGSTSNSSVDGRD